MALATSLLVTTVNANSTGSLFEYVREPLSFLDHHLRHGNSLVGGKIENMGALPDEMELHSTKFGKQVQSKLPELLEPLKRIREMLSDTAEQIEEKDKLYRGFERVREPFRLVGDLWCSAFCPDVEIPIVRIVK